MVKKTNKRIVVLTSGWVFLGVWHPSMDGAPAFLTDAFNVRRWGTAAGLGQLAMTGPTKDTVMDACTMTVFDNPQAILFTIECVW